MFQSLSASIEELYSEDQYGLVNSDPLWEASARLSEASYKRDKWGHQYTMSQTLKTAIQFTPVNVSGFS